MTTPHAVLILGKASPDVLPNAVLPNAVLANAVLAGPWCLPDAVLAAPEPPDIASLTMLPQPLSTPDTLEQAARQARQMVAGIAPRLRARLNARSGVAYSARFWDMALAPWLVRVAEVLIERLHRADQIIRQYKDEPLQVPLLPKSCSFTFASTGDFIFRGMLDPQWNHWLLSRLLERAWPQGWQKVELDAIHSDTPPPAAESLLRKTARAALFALPFPRIKGFSTGQSLRLSLALLGKSTQSDGTIALEHLAEPVQPGDEVPLNWSEDETLDLLLLLLPKALQELPKGLAHAFVPTRVVSVAACEDDSYRLKVAAWRERGCRIVFIQHGGEYGYLRTSVAYPLVEYCQHRFITWGWQKHGTFAGQFLPLPHPQLAAVRGRHKVQEQGPGQQAPLILVGTEMALLPYTLKSMLRGRQFFVYREDKARFLAALPAAIRGASLYRPYFDVPSSLPDAPWILARFPDVRRCTGPLEPHIFGCRLLVLDHAGTTLAQALAANVPTVLFWRPEAVGMTPEAESLLDALRAAEVLHDSPAAAAAHVARIWDDIPAWWNAPKTRAAVRGWASQHALTPDLLDTAQEPPKPLMTLWAEALRRMN